MEEKITLTLDRAEAEILIKSLQRREERLCEIRRELCEPKMLEEYEREELAYFERENRLVERILSALRAIMAS